MNKETINSGTLYQISASEPYILSFCDGKSHIVRLKFAPIYGEGEKIEGVTALFRKPMDNESEDTAIVNQITEYRAEIEKRRALEIAADRLRSLGEMAAGISHELSQPLMGVRGLSEHILISYERGWGISDKKIREKISLIIEQADRMSHIIEHVRSFAANANCPETKLMQVNDAVESTLGLIRMQLRSRGFELEFLKEEALPQVYANPYSLEEVFLNILLNARDAVEEKLKSYPGLLPRIVIKTYVEELKGHKYVSTKFLDNGLGIEEKVIERIFDPFFTTKEPDRGTGLGLSISKSIIEGFGGHISVESQRGEGTAVTVHIPVKADKELK